MLYSKLHDAEAQLFRMESKYVILLKETQEPELGGCVWRGVVSGTYNYICL